MLWTRAAKGRGRHLWEMPSLAFIITRPDRVQLEPFTSKQALRTTTLDLGVLSRPLEYCSKPPGYLENSFPMPLTTIKYRPASAIETPSSTVISSKKS